MARTTRFALAAVLLLSTGCERTLANVELGYARSVTRSPAETAVAGDACFGLGDVSGEVAGGLGVLVRAKIGDDLQQVALGEMAWGAVGVAPDDPVALYGFVGFHEVQLESVYRQLSFGMFSPTAQLGIAVRPIRTTLSVATEYDVRFGPPQNAGYVALMLGWGGLFEGPGGRFWFAR